VGLQRGPHSLVCTIEDLLDRKSSGSGLESREYGSRDPSHWPLSSNSAPISLTSGGRSVGIVRSRTQAKEFSLVFWFSICSRSELSLCNNCINIM
jgi:hypothetical protein